MSLGWNGFGDLLSSFRSPNSLTKSSAKLMHASGRGEANTATAAMLPLCFQLCFHYASNIRGGASRRRELKASVIS